MAQLFLHNDTEDLQAGFRLQSLEVLNWGTFHKMRWQIEPKGRNALLTGDIGSGKSTLVDALTCLLVPHNKIVFNKAAGAEMKERNLLSYVKGEFKKEKEEVTKAARKVYLRPDNDTYTVIVGNFKNQGYQENVSLAQVFWIGKDNKVEKLLIIAKFPLSIKDHFSGFSDINDLRKRLRGTEGILLFNDNFSRYSEQFRRLFGMNSEKAIDLFYQTVSMKSVSSLTSFVRDQMLEKTDVKEQIAALLKRFEDLKKAHESVVHARQQYQILKPLAQSCTDFQKVSEEIEHIEKVMEIAPIWFSEQKWVLLEDAIVQTHTALEKLELHSEQITKELEDTEKRRQSILIDIANNGGKRIEQIAEEIQRQQADKASKRKDYQAYEQLVEELDLKQVENQTDFEENISLANAQSEHIIESETTLRQQRDNLVSTLRNRESTYQSELKELESLKARKTQIPGWLIGFRTSLCHDLRIEEDALPFIGELLKVNETEVRWEGAIEKLLRDAGISLLVPAEHYRSVSRYVNDNPLRGADGRGIKLTYLEADFHNMPRVTKELDEDSIAWKLDIKPETPFYDWLEQYIQRSFGSYIATDVEGLQKVPFGITPQGLIKSGRIRHTKDDRRRIDDRRNYVLGWSNTEKINALERSLHALKDEVDQLEQQVQDVEAQQAANQKKQQRISHLLLFKDYARIDWSYHASRIHELESERHHLLNNNDLLAELERNKDEAEKRIAQVKAKSQQVTEEIGGLKNKISTYEEQRAEAQNYKNLVEQHIKDKWYPVLVDMLQETALTLRNIDKRREDFRKRYQGETGELKRLRGRQMGYRSAIERKMREIKVHSRTEYNEIPEHIDARSEYIDKFQQLKKEDLKRHEARFKEQLNTNVINSISVFDNRLQKHEKSIREKIRTINQHLSEIVYNASQDTYITILMDSTTSKEVRLFREELKKCYIHSFSSKNELYTEEKYEQVKRILDRFASMEYADREWTSTVTDVRQWFEFNASERFRADNTEKEFYEGSGGKSGGQKEKLAYTILASALAYQFGLQFGESKSRSFRFVVIDEAFGRGSDESTRYGLELFKKLNLQLLIVTPLQKIHVIESHVNSFHFVSNRQGNSSQVSNLTKEEYEEEKQRHETAMQNTLSE